ncbi:fused MFS/spermidine synthase [Archangium violaceum]|uniref:fused MFS/spermidine synthase n=1 Tax=Archangium violaceum TaxID=83451 RepID=UPI00193BE4B3|nr:fused MFS/spermidine synthase [Archangium violaceum]QRK09650.1 fused MFS/spermidine synthase [Archangium violaceum]
MNRLSARMFAAVGLLFVVSGMSGLVFEVIWVRYLTLVVGHTTFAATLVVSAFLAGLVLGSLGLGRLADRLKHPLLAYGLLEAATGVLALGITHVLATLPEWLSALGLPGGGPLPLRGVLAFLLVLPPTFVMGGTLPVLMRFVARELEGLGRSFGVLYSLNTLGAALGCGLAGFYLIGAVGLWRTAALAAGLNLLVGLTVFFLHLWLRPEPLSDTAPAPVSASGPAEGASVFQGARRTLLVAAFALCGFASISYEVLWFRVLSTSLDSSTYAFTILLVTFLLGLVIGGLVYSLRLAGRGRELELFVSVEALLSFAGLVSLALLGLAHPVSQVLSGWVGGWGPNAVYVGMLLHSALVILVPASLIGVIFPLVVQLTTRHVASAASNVGLLYSVNTLGGIVGSLLVGFVLVPAVGTQWTFVLVCALNMALALGVQALDTEARPRARRSMWAGAVLLAAAVAMVPGDLLVRAFAEHVDSRVRFVREGVDGALAVLEYDSESVCDSGLYACGPGCRERGFRHQQLLFGSVSYANTVLPRKRYMATLAHLPMLLHPEPKEVLQVCFGTGSTAGSFASHPGLRSLTIVDTNPDVLAAAPHFAEHNHGVAEDPRTHVVFDDGRHFLLSSQGRYDVLSFEPPPPRAAGVVSLYTTEFYREAKRRLAPGGVLAQWIPLQQQSDNLTRGMVASMLEAFSEVTLWIPSDYEAVLVAADRPLAVDAAGWEARWAQEPVARSLADVGFTSPYGLAGTYVAGTEALRRWTRGYAPVTDDLPAVEYFLFNSDKPFEPEALLAVAQPPPLERTERWDAARLARELEANRRVLESTQLKREGDWEAARARVEEARATVGDNAFLSFLLDLELGCLRPAAR